MLELRWIAAASLLVAVATGCESCGEPVEPAQRMVIHAVEVIQYDPNYFEDTVDEGLPDLYVEIRDHASQYMYFTTVVENEASVPRWFDVEAISVERDDFSVVIEILVFDYDLATTQDPIATGLTFSPADFEVDRPETRTVLVGANEVLLHLNWY
jgi:hypothetical protein